MIYAIYAMPINIIHLIQCKYYGNELKFALE